MQEENQAITRNKPPFTAPKKRQPNPLNRFIKEKKNSYNITRKDVAYVYRNIIFTSTFGELKQLLDCTGATEEETKKLQEKRDKMPVLVISIVASVLGDIARGNNNNLIRMMRFVFPDAMNEFDPELLGSGAGGYEQIKDMEDALRLLEGDDSIMIVDKLMLEDKSV